MWNGKKFWEKFREVLRNIRKNFKEEKIFWIKLRDSEKIILNTAL